MSERTQALADAILALTWKEMQELGVFVGDVMGKIGPDSLTNAHVSTAVVKWAEANRAPTVEVIVEDEPPKGAG